MTTSRPTPTPLPALLLAVLLAGGCGTSGGGGGGSKPAGPCESGGGPVITLGGQIQYVRLILTTSGLGPATQTLPARHVGVEVRAAGGGACYGRTSTDGSGNYSLVVDPPAGSQIEVRALSRTLADPLRDVFVHEADPPYVDTHSEINVFQYASAPFTAATTTKGFTVPYTGGPSNRPAIGFGLLDTLLTCWDEARAALGPILPRCHAYTRLGNNFTLGQTSYYSPSARALAFLGGSSGLPDNSDTDYFDDAVVAHEFMHFLNRTIGYSMSRGGAHSGDLLEPNFAWSEGLATGFGCLLLRDPNYIDTTTTSGSLLFRWDIEDITAGQSDNDTIADEASVSEIVYDLGDGGGGPLDGDGDGVSVPYSTLFSALGSMDPQTDAPYLGLFLDRVVAASSLSTTDMANFLMGPPENQQISYPLAGSDVWPAAIGIGGLATGTCDATVPNPCRGYLASRWFTLTLTSAQVVNIDLTITPIAGTPNDLDLYLTPNSDVNYNLASSTNTGSNPESISISLTAGTYLIRVEADCGALNRAGFTLTVN